MARPNIAADLSHTRSRDDSRRPNIDRQMDRLQGPPPIVGWSVLLFLLSGMLGVMAMNGLVPGEDIWKGMEGNMLMPLFTGLFGLPLLIGSSRGRMPEQDIEADAAPSMTGALRGTFMGGLVGWLSGVTATAGAVLTTMLPLPRRS